MQLLHAVQVLSALESSPALAMQELARAQQTVQACLAHVLEEFRAAGAPLQLPQGYTVAHVSAQYAGQILDSIDAAESMTAVPQRLACRDSIAAFAAQEHCMRVRLMAAVAAACVAQGDLPEKLNSVVKPLMGAVRQVSEPALQRTVRHCLFCRACTVAMRVLDRCLTSGQDLWFVMDAILRHATHAACANVAGSGIVVQFHSVLRHAWLYHAGPVPSQLSWLHTRKDT